MNVTIESTFALSTLLNIIGQTFLVKFYSVCIVWNNDFNNLDFITTNGLKDHLIIVSLRSPSNFQNAQGLLLKSIERASCEAFLAFEQDIPIFLDAFQNATQDSSRRYSRNHLILFTRNKTKLLEDFLQHDIFRDVPDVLVIQQIDDDIFNLWTTKFAGKDDYLRPLLLDTYYGNNGTFKYYRNLFPDKLRDQQGRPLRIATFRYKPYIFFDKLESKVDGTTGTEEDAEYINLDGTEGRTMLYFCIVFNCTIDLVVDQEGEWGTLYDNRSGTGMLGNLISRKSDVAIGALYMWLQEYKFLDFSKPISRTGITCLVPKPKRVESWLLPIQPFTPTLWIAVISAIIIACVSYVAMLLTINKMLRRNNPVGETILIGVTTVVQIFLNQAITQNLQVFALRLLIIVCLVTSIMVGNTYGGGLSSILTVPSFEEEIDSVAKLAEHKLTWAATSTAWVWSIEDSQDPITQKALSYFQALPEEELKELSLTDNIGFSIERLPYATRISQSYLYDFQFSIRIQGHYAVGDYITPEAVDKLQIMLEDIYYEYCVLMSFKTWPLLEYFDEFVLRLQQSGIQKYWERLTISRSMNYAVQAKVTISRQRGKTEDEPVPLGLANALSIFVVWGIGLGLSILVFIGELLYYRHCENVHN